MAGGRTSSARIVADLRVAARKGDRAALTVAINEMKTLAFSPRYWEKYLQLLGNPLARLVDLLVIKQGERIARQKGWKLPKPVLRPAARSAPKPSKTPTRRSPLPPRIRQPAESVLIDDPTWRPAGADSLTGRRGASILPRGGMANG